ncbi:MAG: alpha/beta hydrolase [Polyangiaceae bacterium]
MTTSYSVRGSGQTMIFFHNAGSNRDLWSRQIDEFAKTYRTVAVDLPGYGAGEDLRGDATLDRYADFVEALVSSVTDAPPILVGHCIGAAMVLRATLRNPKRAKALVLFNVATRAGIREGGYGALLRTLRRAPWLVPIAARVTELSPPAVRRASLKSQYLRTEDDPYLDELVRLNGDRKHIDSLSALAPAMDTYGALEHFEKPTGFPSSLLLWGTKNRVLPLASSGAVRASLRPDAWHEIVAGHLTMREAHEESNARMRAFLEAHAA